MTTIYLLSHVQSKAHSRIQGRDWPLTEHGKWQAKTLAPLLGELGVQVLYSSPYHRCVQTVAPFAKEAEAPVRVDAAFRECDVTHESVEDFQGLLERSWEDFDFAWRDGETCRSGQSRIMKALGQLAGKHPGRNILVCTHPNLIGLVLKALDPDFTARGVLAMRSPDLFKLTKEGSDPFVRDPAFDASRLLAPVWPRETSEHSLGVDFRGFGIGMPMSHVVLKEASPSYERCFDALKKTLEEHLDPALLTLHHIGSTAIGGIRTRPIIDVLGVAPNPEALERIGVTLESLGFSRQEAGDTQGHYILTDLDRSIEFVDFRLLTTERRDNRDYLDFRDELQGDDELARKYQRVKDKASKESESDPKAYPRAKAEFVRSFLAGELRR